MVRVEATGNACEISNNETTNETTKGQLQQLDFVVWYCPGHVTTSRPRVAIKLPAASARPCHFWVGLRAMRASPGFLD